MNKKSITIPNFWIIPSSTIEKDFIFRRLDSRLGFSKTNPDYLIHKAFCLYRKTKWVKTACTKTKSEVSGGGRKPWPQKGRGRARVGSIRSPLWRGGGVSFGPKPVVYSPKLNNREYDNAIRTLLFEKQNSIIPISIFEGANKSESSKNLAFNPTKNAKQIINQILEKNNIQSKDIIGNKVITIVVSSQEYKFLDQTLFVQGIKNISKLHLLKDTDVNLNHVIRSQYILLTAYASHNLTSNDLRWKVINK